MRAALAAISTCALCATSAWAQPFPARSGEAGILDVPDAEVVGPGGGQLAIELGFDHTAGLPDDLGALPMYAVGGVTRRLDLGLTMRDGGQPADPRPAHMMFGAAAKLQLWAPAGAIPGAALSAVADRFNAQGLVGARLALSTSRSTFRVAAFGGVEAPAERLDGAEATAGLAASLFVTPTVELAAEALGGPRGNNFGGAVRWMATRAVGTSLGVNYFPGDDAFRVFLALAFAPQPKAKEAAPPAESEVKHEQPVVVAAPQFADARPHFRLRIATRGPERLRASSHLQYAPPTPRIAATAGPSKAEAGARAAVPSLEDLAEAQIREQEALADTRERRIRATGEQLEARERAALEHAKELAGRERDLAGREQQLDARERRLVVRGAPTQQQRQLESLEAQLGSQERSLSAQERSYGPAIDAAEGRERDAAGREDAERQEANRLAASVSGASSHALQLEIRKQVVAARNRQHAALEARLVARGERIDALERQLRTKEERLDTWSRRLDTRAERLDLLEKRLSESRQREAEPEPAAKPAEAKDKAVFVMVVKSPTAIVKERTATPAEPAPGQALHPGVAVEKAVAAATVVMFPNPASQISELDREAIDNIAKLAAKERCELLIWARAKNPGLMAEAQRRAEEIRTRVLAAGPLDAKQVVTRITTRPGAQGVDVVVSALRESAKPPEAAATPPQTAGLLAGESGKRQIREAVQGAQRSIEACVGVLIEAKKLERAEGILKLTVSKQGRVTKVLTGEGDLSGAQIEECLTGAAKGWLFPPAEVEYVVDVPITVIRGGAK